MERVGKTKMRLTQRGAVRSVSIWKKGNRSEAEARVPLQLQGR